MTKRAMVLGHADADGYLASEQTRENLEKEGLRVVDVVVDPEITSNYNFWERGFQDVDLREADFVVVVDIMLNPRAPAISFDAMTRRVRSEPATEFVVIDHHRVEGLPPDQRT